MGMRMGSAAPAIDNSQRNAQRARESFGACVCAVDERNTGSVFFLRLMLSTED